MAKDTAADEPSQSVERKKCKKRKQKKGVVQKSFEERLAAFGEAFMDSIEGPAPATRRTEDMARAPTARLPQGNSIGSSKPKKTRKRKISHLDRDGLTQEMAKKIAARDSQSNGARAADKPAPNIVGREPSNASRITQAKAKSAPAVSQDMMADDTVNSRSNSIPNSSFMPPLRRVSAAERRRFMSGKVSQIRSSGPSGTSSRSKGSQSQEDDERFKKTLKEVIDFVAPELPKQVRQQYEEAKIRALGGTFEKRQKDNYRVLQQEQKGAEKKRQKLLDNEKTLGISKSVSQHRSLRAVDKLMRAKKEMMKDKVRRREDGLLRLGMGAREKGGMAVIPQSQIRSFQRKSKKR